MKRRNFLKSLGSTAVGLAAIPVVIKASKVDVPALVEEPVKLGVSPMGDEHRLLSKKFIREQYGFDDGDMWLAEAGLDRPETRTHDGGIQVYLDGKWNDYI